MGTYGKFGEEPLTKKEDHNISISRSFLSIFDSLNEEDRLKLLELCNLFASLGDKDKDMLLSFVGGLSGRLDRT